MNKTLIVWRRLGKEHGEHMGFRVNEASVVNIHLSQKVAEYRKVPDSDWRWWQSSDNVIVERPIVTEKSQIVTPSTLIYYFVDRNWIIMQNVTYPGFDTWPWYVHIGDVTYHEQLGTYVMRDLFCDVLVKANCREHTVLDLDELGEGYEMGLISLADLKKSLASTQKLIDSIRQNHFPPDEIGELERVMREIR